MSAVESVTVVGFFLGYKSIGPSLWISLTHKTPSYGTKMLLKVIFDKTAVEEFKISHKFKQNIDETHSKPPKSK